MGDRDDLQTMQRIECISGGIPISIFSFLPIHNSLLAQMRPLSAPFRGNAPIVAATERDLCTYALVTDLHVSFHYRMPTFPRIGGLLEAYWKPTG